MNVPVGTVTYAVPSGTNTYHDFLPVGTNVYPNNNALVTIAARSSRLRLPAIVTSEGNQ